MAATKKATGTAAKTATKFTKLRGAENVSTHVSDDVILLKINRNVKGRPSKTGKTVVIASSRGNVEIDGTGGLKIGLNAYVPADAPEDDDDDE